MAKENGGAVAEPSWEELLGSNKWEGILDPLDLSLRRFIIRCGDFCQCSSDAFDSDDKSEYYGSSRYGKKSFFNKVKFEFAAAYQVSALLYTTSALNFIITWDKTTNFQGYIATSTDAVSQLLGRREIYVIWRGTVTSTEWAENADFRLVAAAPLLPPGDAGKDAAPKVMEGFLDLYTGSNPDSPFTKLSARDQLHAKINELIEEYKGEKLSIVVTGHSQGAALATLSAFDLAENGVGDIPVTAIAFGSPRVGDTRFKERAEQKGNLRILRVSNKHDLVPNLPLLAMGYDDVGEKLKIDGSVSPYLKTCPESMWDWHNLQGMLHVVAGWQGKGAAFELKVKRSLALVNKYCDYLKAEYKIPASWWVVENKGMILNDKGEWVLAPPLLEDLPQPEF